jgi:hypothetical protein
MEKIGFKYTKLLVMTAMMLVLAFSATTFAAGKVLPGGASNTSVTTIPVTTSTIAPTTTSQLPPTANATASGGFLNGNEVTFIYTGNYICSNSNTLLGNSSEVANSQKVTQCEVGASALNQTGQLPVWVSVPAFAGLSIFGVPSLGATSQGFPVFQNHTIVTDCGAGGTNSSCTDHPTFLYSPDFTAVEKHMNITNGIFGLPEGVLPTPAHTHIVSSAANGSSIGWYAITVLVFDPNIMPNATTGKCTQVVPSNLTNATANCLTSLTALQNALVTSSSATAINGNNPIWQTLGGPTDQVVVPGATMVTQLSNDNTNLVLDFAVKDTNYYAQFLPKNTTTVATTTIAQNTTVATSAPTTTVPPTTNSGSSNTLLYVVVGIVILVVIVLIGWRMMGSKK